MSATGNASDGGPALQDAKLRTFFEQCPYLCGLLDLDGVMTEVNEAALAASKLRRDDAINRPFWETPWWAGHEESQEWLQSRVPRVLAGKQCRRVLTYRAADGTTRLSDVTMSLSCDEQERPLFIGVIGQDVTDRVNAETELADSVRRMNVASEAAHFGTFRVDLSDRRFWTSPELNRLLDLDPEQQFDVDAVRALVDERDLAKLTDVVAETLNDVSRRDFETEFRMLKPGPRNRLRQDPEDGTRWLIVRGRTVIEHPAGDESRPAEVTAITGAVLDITRQRQAEREFLESQQINSLALETARLGIWVADLNTHTARRDATFNELLGLPAEVSVRPLYDAVRFVHPDDQKEVFAAFRRSVDAGTPFMREFRIVRADGVVRWVRDRGVPVEGFGKRWIGATTDVTEDHEAEARLREALQKAEAANVSKSEFIANMSHEIRTPMTSVMGYAELLQQGERDPERSGHLRTITRNGELLLALINDILDLSKIEAGRMDVTPTIVDLEDLVSDVYGMMEVRALEKDLPLVVSVGEAVPQFICTDAMRVRQVLINLLGNAVKFTENGEVALRVSRADRQRSTSKAEDDARGESRQERHEADCEDEADADAPGTDCEEEHAGDTPHVRFEVVDTGIGISDSQKARLFKPFAQADTSVSRTFGGTGLGLAICERLATILGGTIEYESQTGEGSRFSLILPCDVDTMEPPLDPQAVQSRLEAADENRQEEAPLPPTAAASAVRVLVVDDQPDIRFLTQEILRKAAVDVVTAVDGIEAIAQVEATREERPYDMILLDMQMPKLSGYETAERLRKLGYDRPIVALTADAMHGDMVRCLESGCNEYLSKPINAQELLRVVRRHAGLAGETG